MTEVPAAPVLDLGGLRVTPILASRFALDGGAMYGVIPRPLWSRVTPPDERHRIPMASRSLLVQTDNDECVLVDAGLGQRFDDRSRDIFDVDEEVTLEGSLDAAGLASGKITHVLFTHLHFDHCAGALCGDDVPAPLFPHAEHIMPSGEVEDALRGHSIMRTSYVADDITCLLDATRVQRVEGEVEVLPGIHTLPTGGHTPHHQAILLRGRRGTVAFPGDLLPTRHHLKPHWIMAYDMLPYDTLTVKSRFLQQALAEDWIIAWDHDPASPFSRLQRQDGDVVAIDLDDGAGRGS